MVVYRCRECDAAVSRPVAELADEALLRGGESVVQLSELGDGEPDYVPEGFYLDGPEESPVPGADGWPVLNPEDLVGTTLDTDVYTGCCGPDGSQGPNTDCPDGHKVGTERGDCWTVHSVALDPEAVVATDADETVTSGLDQRTPEAWVATAADGSTSDRRRAIVLSGVHEVGDAVPVLTDVVVNGPAPLRDTAVRALARTGQEDAAPALGAALHDPDPSLRGVAAQALGSVDSEEATDLLLDRLVEEPEPAVCREIRRSVGDGVTQPRLRTCLRAASTDPARKVILRLVGAVRGDGAVATLREVVTDPDQTPPVREEAVRVLLRLGPDAVGSQVLSTAALTSLLVDVADAVDRTEVKALCLRELAHRDVADPEVRARRHRLFEALRDDPTVDEDVRSATRAYFDGHED